MTYFCIEPKIEVKKASLVAQLVKESACNEKDPKIDDFPKLTHPKGSI